VLICLESGVFLLAPYFAALIHFRTFQFADIERLHGTMLPRAVTFAALALLSMTAMGLYNARRSQLPALLVRIALAVSVMVFLSIVIHDVRPNEIMDRSPLLLAALLAFVGAASIRVAFDHMVDEAQLPRRILVLGAGRRASGIAKLRRSSDRRGFEVAGYLPTAGDQPGTVPRELCFDVRGPLLRYCTERRIEEIVVAMDDHRRGFPLEQLNECRNGGIRITSKGMFLERETEHWRLDAIDPRWGMVSRWIARRRSRGTSTARS
jgi:FlaA1/EpsC-like NDP-sugar epimerase